MDTPTLKTKMSLNRLAAEIHEDNRAAGWWDDCPNDDYTLFLAMKILLIHSEVSELAETLRTGGPSKKLPGFSHEEEEIGDIFIRLLDYTGSRKIDVDGVIAAKREYNLTRGDHTREARNAPGGKKF